MTQREHNWIRLVALAVILAISFLPRAERSGDRQTAGGATAEVIR